MVLADAVQLRCMACIKIWGTIVHTKNMSAWKSISRINMMADGVAIYHFEVTSINMHNNIHTADFVFKIYNMLPCMGASCMHA